MKSLQDNLVINTTFKASHKEYISDVQWSPSNLYIFATAGYNGTYKLWNIRSILLPFASGLDEKVLYLAFRDCREKHEVFCTGIDYVI